MDPRRAHSEARIDVVPMQVRREGAAVHALLECLGNHDEGVGLRPGLLSRRVLHLLHEVGPEGHFRLSEEAFKARPFEILLVGSMGCEADGGGGRTFHQEPKDESKDSDHVLC